MTGRIYRVLVSGSRGFPWPPVVHRDLDEERARLDPGDTMVVVHGDCDKGPDAYGKGWAAYHEAHPNANLAAVRQEKHPADWTAPCRSTCGKNKHGENHRRPSKNRKGDYCPAAGDYRNQDMVDTRPDKGLFYFLDDSHGTTDCFKRLRAARIPWEAKGAYSPPKGGADGAHAKRDRSGTRGSTHRPRADLEPAAG